MTEPNKTFDQLRHEQQMARAQAARDKANNGVIDSIDQLLAASDQLRAEIVPAIEGIQLGRQSAA